MHHLKGVLWLLAWSVWFILGVGLYRELPRELATPIAVVPTGKDISPAGFVGNTNRFVLIRRLDRITSKIETYDAETGALAATTIGPAYEDLLWPDYFLHERGVILAKELPNHEGTAWAPGLHVLDLVAGKWRRVTERTVQNGSPHETKPWVVIVEGNRGSETRVVVADWETGRTTVVRRFGKTEGLSGRVFPLSDTDRVVIPLRTSSWFGSESFDSVEIWKLQNVPVLEKTLSDLPIFLFPSFSAGGRVAFANPHGTPAVDVYDFNEERYLFSNPPRDQRPPAPPPNTGFPYSTVLSPSGRRVFGGDPTTLRNVDSGSVIWQGEPGLWNFAIRDLNAIFATETWDNYWRFWFPRLKYQTSVVRELESGLVLFRVKVPTLAQMPRYWNTNRTMSVASDGSVYRMPFPVNWPLLVLCQFILALPLVLMWTILRWRRRRRAKRLLVKAAP